MQNQVMVNTKFENLCKTLLEGTKQKGVDGKACWDGYKRMGTKKKGGKTVDNCVKIKEGNAFRPSNSSNLKPIEQKIPSQEDIVDMVQYYRSEQGMSKWKDFKRFVEMSGSDWSNTMAYLMTGKGPGDYGDRLD